MWMYGCLFPFDPKITRKLVHRYTNEVFIIKINTQDSFYADCIFAQDYFRFRRTRGQQLVVNEEQLLKVHAQSLQVILCEFYFRFRLPTKLRQVYSRNESTRSILTFIVTTLIYFKTLILYSLIQIKIQHAIHPAFKTN